MRLNMNNCLEYFVHSVVTHRDVYPNFKKKSCTETEIMNLCLNMILYVSDKYGTGDRLFDILPYGTRFKTRTRKNLIIFLSNCLFKCTGITFKYTPIDFNDYIKIEESEWSYNGDGSYDNMRPHSRRDSDILDCVCRMIYVLSDKYSLSKVFNMFPEKEYWEVCEWDEVVPGMTDYFEIMFMKPEYYENRYKKRG